MSGRLPGLASVIAVIAATAVLVVIVPLDGAQQDPTDGAGKAAYERVCAGCHGATGGGDIGPRLVPFTRSGRELQGIVREGTGMMPALSARDITDEEIAAVAEYLKSLKDIGETDGARE